MVYNPAKPSFSIPYLAPSITLSLTGLKAVGRKVYSKDPSYVHDLKDVHAWATTLGKLEADTVTQLCEDNVKLNDTLKNLLPTLLSFVEIDVRDVKIACVGASSLEVGNRRDEVEPKTFKGDRNFHHLAVFSLEELKISSSPAGLGTTNIVVEDLALSVGEMDISPSRPKTPTPTDSSSPTLPSPSPPQINTAPTLDLILSPHETLTYNLTPIISPISALVSLESLLPNLVNKSLQFSPSYITSRHSISLSISTLKIHLEPSPLFKALHILDDWVSTYSEMNVLVEKVVKTSMVSLTYLEEVQEIYRGFFEEKEETFTVKGRQVTVERFGRMSEDDCILYRNCYKSLRFPPSPTSKASPSTTTSEITTLTSICTLLESRMVFEEIMEMRRIACPALFSLKGRSKRIHDYCSFWGHTVLDSKGNYGKIQSMSLDDTLTLDSVSSIPPNYPEAQFPLPPDLPTPRVHQNDGSLLIYYIRETYRSVSPKTSVKLKLSRIILSVPDCVTTTGPQMSSRLTLKNAEVDVEIRSPCAEENMMKRMTFRLEVRVEDVSFKPEEEIELSKNVPMMNDGSGCGLVHRLEDIKYRDTKISDGEDGVEDGGCEPDGAEDGLNPMVAFSMENSLEEGLEDTDGTSDIKLALSDIIVVLLPTQLFVAMNSLQAIGECPTLTLGPASNDDDAASDLGESVFSDSESDGTVDSVSHNESYSPRRERSGSEQHSTSHSDSEDEDGSSDEEEDDNSVDSSEMPRTVLSNANVSFANTPSSMKGDLEIIDEAIINDDDDDDNDDDDGNSPPVVDTPSRKSKNLSKFFGEDVSNFSGTPPPPSQLNVEMNSNDKPDDLDFMSPLTQQNDNDFDSSLDDSRAETPTPLRPTRRHSHKPSHSPPPAPPPPPQKTNGTILKGASCSYSVSIHNLSVALLLDEKVLDAGIIDMNLSKLDVLFRSNAAKEDARVETGRITARGCRLHGSTFQTHTTLKLTHLPFKSAVAVGPIVVVYSGEGVKPSAGPILDSPRHTFGDSHSVISPESVGSFRSRSSQDFKNDFETSDDAKQTVKIVGTVFVSLHIGIEYVQLNLTPSLNAIFAGCINTLSETFAVDEGEMKKQEEERLELLEQRLAEKENKYIKSQQLALKSIWNKIDEDRSDSLDHNEVKKVVVQLLQKNADKQKTKFKMGQSNQITTKELDRELSVFMSIVDANMDNSISYSELEKTMILMTKAKKMAVQNSRHGIVYFSNLKEYSSSIIVHAITGKDDPENFDPPMKWVNKNGIKEFFALYNLECGTKRESLNKQDVRVVQRKLVRLVQNFKFAKFCWERLVQPSLRGSNYHATWFLDDDFDCKYNSGAIDVLASHVHLQANRQLASIKEIFRYDTNIEAGIDNVTITAGNALLFSKSLVNIGVDGTKAICKLVFTPEDDGLKITGESNQTDDKSKDASSFAPTGSTDEASEYGLDVHLETTLGMQYLNSTHDVMATLIEPWSLFVNAGYNTGSQTAVQADEEDGEDHSSDGQKYSFDLLCPEILKIDFTPNAIKTLTILSDMMKVTPEVFEKLSADRALEELEDLWFSVDETMSENLNREQVLPIVKKFFGTSIAGVDNMTEAETDEMVTTFISIVDVDKDGMIRYEELEEAVQQHKMSAKSIFENSSLIRIENAIGLDIHFGSVAHLRKEIGEAGTAHNYELCKVGDTKPLKLGEDFLKQGRSRFFKDTDTLALKFENETFDSLEDIKISAFQKVIVPLRSAAGHQQDQIASRFQPALVMAPMTDALETVTMQVRSCFVLETQVPIEISIYAVNGEAQAKHRNKGVEHKIQDLFGRSSLVFSLTLKEAGARAAIPLNCIISGRLHLLQVKDLGQDKFRTPILLDRDFLWNISNVKEINNLHRAMGIRVARTRLNLQKGHTYRGSAVPNTFTVQDGRARFAAMGNDKKELRHLKDSSDSTTHESSSRPHHGKAWDTTIFILPSVVISNSLPFSINFRCRQKLHDEDAGTHSRENRHKQLLNEMYGSKHDMLGGKKKSSLDKKAERRNSMAGRLLSKTRKYSKNKVFKKRRVSSSAPKTQDHYATSRANYAPFRMEGRVAKGMEFKLTGVDMGETLLIQICKEGDGRWSPEIELSISNFLKGSQTMSPVRGSLNNWNVRFTVSGVTTPSQIHRICIFSPYWIVNRTGCALSYMVSGMEEDIADTALAGLPVLTDSVVSGPIGNLGNLDGSCVSCIPNQGVFLDVLNDFWRSEMNGNLVCNSPFLTRDGEVEVEYSDKVGMDNVGQEGEISCGDITFGVSVETLTGIFHESNVIMFCPRFFFRNRLEVPINLCSVRGRRDSLKGSSLRSDWDNNHFSRTDMTVGPGEAAVIFVFQDVTGGGIHIGNSSERLVCFRTIDPDTQEKSTKIHFVPVDTLTSHYFSESSTHRSVDTILSSKNTKNGPSTVVTIEDCSHKPPYRLENRSCDHSVLIIQDDPDATPLFLEPLTWCNFAYDNPHGSLRIKAATINTKTGYGLPPGSVSVLAKGEGGGKHAPNVFREMRRSLTGGHGLNPVDGNLDNSGMSSGTATSAYSAASNGGGVGTLVDAEVFTQDPEQCKRVLFSRHAKGYCIDKVGRRKNLPCPRPSRKKEDGDHNRNRQDIVFVEVRIFHGSKVVSFNDSIYRINQSKIGMLKSGGAWRNIHANLRLEGIMINMIDEEPKEMLSIILKEFLALKEQGDITFMLRLRHVQIDNMLDGARYPIVLQPSSRGLVDEREKSEKVKTTADGDAGDPAVQNKGHYWQQEEEKPVPVFEANCSYIPLTNMVWVPLILVHLLPLKVQIDLSYILQLVNVITSAIPETNEGASEEDVAIAYDQVEKKMEVVGKRAVKAENRERSASQIDEGMDEGEEDEEVAESFAYVERLLINETWVELELFLRSDKEKNEEEILEMKEMAFAKKKEREEKLLKKARENINQWAKDSAPTFGVDRDSDGEESDDEDEDNVEALNSFGRTTSSSLSASVLTWLTNIAGSFAHISPTFSFAVLDIPNHFGQLDMLFSNIARHYTSRLLYQSYKVVGSIHLLGDPFSLLNSITTGALKFFTVTRDEVLAKGSKGFGGGVKSLLQGVVGGTSKSTAMALGGAADLVSEISGNGLVMQQDEKPGPAPRHVGEGLMKSGMFFGKTLSKGIGGVLANPVKGLRKGPSGFVGGLASGVGGLVATPFVAAFGSAAILTSSIDATTHMFDAIQIDSRCRPRRNFGEWGAVTEPLEVDFMKAVGIRVHNLKFTAADKKNIARGKNKKKIVIRGCGRKYKLKGRRPEASQRDFQGEVSYTVGYNETVVVRASDLQLYSELKVEVWDKSMTKQRPIALAFLQVSEIIQEIGEFNTQRMNKLKESLSCSVDKIVGNDDRAMRRKRSESTEYLKKMRYVSQRNLTMQLGKAGGGENEGGAKGGGVSRQAQNQNQSSSGERRNSINANWKDDDEVYSRVTSILPAVNEVVVYVPSKKANTIVEMMKDAKDNVTAAGKGALGAIGRQGSRKRLESSDSDDFWEASKTGAGGGWIGTGDDFREDDLGESGQVYGVLTVSYFPVEF
ncbi:hypothetical protein TrST_g1205 [Triparma strigata]|uniref:EF-hand domain-containing protein n=1 Tax=Triparma strigata TaxID=1606541 RepID=A0A9W7B043_9STRA|nr:hypothetical protein TrST_g1205 [Triparma strigata]